MIGISRHRFQRLPIAGDPGDLLQIRIMDETGGRCEDINGALFQAPMILIWIDRLIYVVHMSSCASTRTLMMNLRDRQLSTTVDPSDIRGLGTARRHFRRGAASLLKRRSTSLKRLCCKV